MNCVISEHVNREQMPYLKRLHLCVVLEKPGSCNPNIAGAFQVGRLTKVDHQASSHWKFGFAILDAQHKLCNHWLWMGLSTYVRLACLLQLTS